MGKNKGGGLENILSKASKFTQTLLCLTVLNTAAKAAEPGETGTTLAYERRWQDYWNQDIIYTRWHPTYGLVEVFLDAFIDNHNATIPFNGMNSINPNALAVRIDRPPLNANQYMALQDWQVTWRPITSTNFSRATAVRDTLDRWFMWYLATPIAVSDESPITPPKLLVYPNPLPYGHDVSIQNIGFGDLRIYDVTGRLLTRISNSPNQNDLTLDFQSLGVPNSGIYFISGGETKLKLLVK